LAFSVNRELSSFVLLLGSFQQQLGPFHFELRLGPGLKGGLIREKDLDGLLGLFEPNAQGGALPAYRQEIGLHQVLAIA